MTINGVKYSARSSITIRPTTFEREAGANQDGTLYVTTKPMPAEMEITLSDKCGLYPDVLIHECNVDVTAEIFDMGRTYLWTEATVVGRPEIDSESGEISGLVLVTDQPKQIGA